MLKYINNHKSEDCCGCKACSQICAHKAITFKPDNEGFEYPELDETACINCGLCEAVCPMTNAESVKNEEGTAIAIQNNNLQDLKASSSGGGFIAIAKYVISKGGVVYGAAYYDKNKVRHQRVECNEDLIKLTGSKYVQSDIADTYIQAKNDLRNGRFVYFTGTPCQVAGLKLFLKKEYQNLLTSDLICHGTPSVKIFQNTVNHIKDKVGGELLDYSFRDKKIHGWSCSSSSSWQKGNKEYYLKYSKDMEAYFKAFISGELMRMNCYQCPFATRKRVGDITLADFWGVRKEHPEFRNIRNGVGLVLVNTQKGREVYDVLKEEFYSMSIPMDMASEHNHNLHAPTPLTEGRKDSYKLAFVHYDTFVDKYYKGSFLKERLKIEFEYFIRKHDSIFRLISKIAHIRK